MVSAETRYSTTVFKEGQALRLNNQGHVLLVADEGQPSSGVLLIFNGLKVHAVKSQGVQGVWPAGFGDQDQFAGISARTAKPMRWLNVKYADLETPELPSRDIFAVLDVAGDGSVLVRRRNVSDRIYVIENGHAREFLAPDGFVPPQMERVLTGGALNSRGQVAVRLRGARTLGVPDGSTGTEFTAGHCLLFTGKAVVDVGDFEPCALSDSGLVAGTQTTGKLGTPAGIVARAFVGNTAGSHAISLPVGVQNSVARDVNSDGIVIGQAIRDNTPFAFVYRDGVLVDLNSLVNTDEGLHLSDAISVNDRGQILCRSNKGSVLLNAVSEGREGAQ